MSMQDEMAVGAQVTLECQTGAGRARVSAPVRIFEPSAGRGNGMRLELEGLPGHFDLETTDLPDSVTLWRLVSVGSDDACICSFESEDRGGGYSELVQEYEPACPVHGERKATR